MVSQGVALRVGKHTIQLSILDEEDIPAKAKRFQPYGFSYHPFPGCEPVTVFPSGDRSVGLCIIQGDSRYTLDLLEGEAALHDEQGQMVKIARDRVLVSSPKKIRIESPDIEIVASERFAFQVNGHGQEWLPNRINTWQIGEMPGEAHPISPPEF